MKDDSGSYAAFTEQGSSASQMTAAKVMGRYIKTTRMRRTSTDTVSAYTQVKMEDAPSLFKIPKSECPDIWIRLPKYQWPKSWSSMEDPVVPLVLDHVCLGCTRRECQTSKDIVDNYRSMFESRISAGSVEKLQVQGNLTPYDMEGHAKK